MKKYFLTILQIFSIVFITSCSDEIDDLEPFSQGNPDTFLTSVRNFQSVVNGALQQMRLYYESPGSGLQGVPDILSDNTIIVRTGRLSNRVYHEYEYNPNSAGAVPLYFNKAYNTINTTNLVIEKIDNLPDTPDKDNILGQALAIRAFAHFDLVRIYAKIPTQSADANASDGIVYMKAEDGDTSDDLALPARETVASNYTEIIEDLERSLTLLGDNNATITPNVVNGILSRVYLYNGEYQKSIDAADAVTIGLAKLSELSEVYTDVSKDGIVFELSIDSGKETTNNNVGVLYSQSNSRGVRSEYAVDFEFLNSIVTEDIRKDIIQFIGTWSDNEYNAIKKFRGEAGEVNGRVDIKVIRAAEVLLNKAEAQYELGLVADALISLNALRAERYTGFTNGTETGQALEDAIQFERRVELSFEGHRFFDIKRRGESIIRSSFGDLADGTGTPPVQQTLPAGDFKFQFPIPIDEINVNPNFSQNPGY